MSSIISLDHVYVGAILTLLTVLAYALYLAFLHPLAKFPGPRSWTVSRIPWSRAIIKGEIADTLCALHEKHGPVVRIAPDELSTVSPTAWAALYEHRPLFTKDQYVQTPPLNGSHSLFTAEGDTHTRIRGTMVNAFSDKALRDQSPVIEDYAAQLTDRLAREVAATGGTIDMQRYFGYASFDAISALSYGEAPDALASGEHHDWIKNFFMHARFSTLRSALTRYPFVDSVLSAVFLRLTAARRAKNWQLGIERVERRLAAGEGRADFMTPVLGRVREDAADSGKGRAITKAELTANGLAMVIANCQLATVALTSALYLLLRNPHCLTALRKELAQFANEKDLTVQSTQDLTYLRAVLDETLRLHHPTPITLPRYIPTTQVIDGYVIPGGTVIGINLAAIQRSALNFTAPDEFHPERFLLPLHPLHDSRFDKDKKAAFQPFSTGPRNCIGQKVFLAQARVMLSRVLWRFDAQLADKHAEDWLAQKAWLVYEPTPLEVRLAERKGTFAA